MWTADWQLVVVNGPDKGLVYPLDSPTVTVGRTRAGTQTAKGWVFLPDQTVSGTHAKLRWNDQKETYTFTNCSTTNPSTVNGNPCGEIDLTPGDQVTMGLATFELVGLSLVAPEPLTRRVEIERPPANLPPYSLEFVAGPENGTRRPISGLVVALGGSHPPQGSGRWYDQEVAFEDASVPAQCLALKWKEAFDGFELTRRPGAEPEVLIRRVMDDLEWVSKLTPQPALLRNQDVIQVGNSTLKLASG